MFLVNISNHPHTGWSEEQKGNWEISSFDFPNIPPQATSEEVAEMAIEMADNIIRHFNPETTSVHVMGEMTYTHHVVSLLQHAGFRCVASTTNRSVVINDDGTKTVTFKFVQFREYPKL